MTKDAFLKRLNDILLGLKEDEREKTQEYYAEMIADRMEDGMSEEDAVAALGAPEAIAAQILREAGLEPDPSLLPPDPAEAERQKKRFFGVLIALVVLAAIFRFGVAGWLSDDFTMNYVMPQGSFSTIDADLSFYNVQILSGREAMVDFPENRLNTCEVEVKNGVLTVRQKQRLSFLNIFLPHVTDDLTVTIYLPEGSYDKLNVTTASGGVTIDEEFTFKSAAISSSSGQITLGTISGDELTVSSTSGAITTDHLNISGAMALSSTSGNLMAANLRVSEGLTLVSSSGVVSCQNTQADTIDCKTTSGAIRLSDLTAKRLSADSTSGTVYGTDLAIDGSLMGETTSGNLSLYRTHASALLSAKSTSGTVNLDACEAAEITVKTLSGTLSLADTSAGGRLTATSTSGKVDLINCNAPDIALKTSSGSIKAVLPQPMQFTVSSSSGRVRCPESAGEGTLKAQSSSGNIDITIK